MKRWVDENVRLLMIAKITIRNFSKTNDNQSSLVVKRILHSIVEKLENH